jgi:hypothetical protein
MQRILEDVPDDALVLDVGGWGKPFRRADAVLDRMPYGTRGLYGFDGDGPERFDEDSWIVWDICARQPWPIPDKKFDFVVCSQTLEDLRDPIWVCSEILRVGRSGYIEVPSRLEEQSYGVQGPWVGWGHHHWLIDVGSAHLDFVFKHHTIHGRPSAHFPSGFVGTLSEEERTGQLWWTGSFTFEERVLGDAESLDGYLDDFVAAELARRQYERPVDPGPNLRQRTTSRMRRASRRQR